MIHMSEIEYLIGSGNISTSPLKVYSDEAVSFIADLSSRIMKSSLVRAYPDIMTFGFWCRKGNILRLKDKYPESDIRLGRGVCFHVTPSNIPVSFAFSYIFGLLAGCSNIVRLPSRKFAQIDIIISILRETLKTHPDIYNRTAFIRYPVNQVTTEHFSLMADARMIWGGDGTVTNIRCMKTHPRCIDVFFPDRYSICVIDADAVKKSDDNELAKLADNFYNDTYLMDQNACSSPKIVCWINDCQEGRSKFWDAVINVVRTRYDLQAATSVDKFTKSCEDAIERFDNIVSIEQNTNLLYRVEIRKLTPETEDYRGVGGYFYEFSMEHLEDLISVVTEKIQTITWFGLDPKTIQNVVINNRLRGVDRIAPIGKAMDIGVIWDGYDLIRMLSRIVNVE